MLQQISDPSPPISYPHAPPPMDDKKIPFLISSDRAWPRLHQEGCVVA